LEDKKTPVKQLLYRSFSLGHTVLKLGLSLKHENKRPLQIFEMSVVKKIFGCTRRDPRHTWRKNCHLKMML